MAFLIGPVSAECCDDPCDGRDDPCDPCDCPNEICADDTRGASPDFSGTYTQNGYWEGTIAYEKNGGGAWFWRDWDFFPVQGWWVVSPTKGDFTDGVTQDETGEEGDACPNGDYWTGLGTVVSGAC